MNDDLANEYDVIVLGTGLAECILAAACARVGKTVLHMDKNEYYGGDWATFNFEGVKKWIAANNVALTRKDAESCDEYEKFLENEESLYAVCPQSNFQNIKEYSFLRHKADRIADLKEIKEEDLNVEDSATTDATKKISEEISENVPIKRDESSESPPPVNQSTKSFEFFAEDLADQWRKFNIDLAPKLLFSRGLLVELLLSSNIARYAEFKSVSRVLTYLNGKLEQVPCSRADVFSTRDVTIVEKRMLMKFLTFCIDYMQNSSEYAGFEEKPFVEFLKSRKMTPNVVHYIVNSIAMVDETATTLKGLEATQQFLNSLGRFGNTPFLWPLYGSGELPQCFCRLCAVFGGVYYLTRKAEAVILNFEKKCVGIITERKRINCKFLIAESSFLYTNTRLFEKKLKDCKKLSRAIILTNKSILDSEKEQLTFLRLPPCKQHSSAITIIELGTAAAACPKGLYVVHMNCEQNASAEQDLKPAVELLFQKENTDEDKPKILWVLYFNYSVPKLNEYGSNFGDNVASTSGPNIDIDFDHAVSEAKHIFEKLFPEDEFLPRAPDPDEIKLDDETTGDSEAAVEGVVNNDFKTPEDKKPSDDEPSTEDKLVQETESLDLSENIERNKSI